jgi:hypothetical protein
MQNDAGWYLCKIEFKSTPKVESYITLGQVLGRLARLILPSWEDVDSTSIRILPSWEDYK